MTRKRLKKLLMGRGLSRNRAEELSRLRYCSKPWILFIGTVEASGVAFKKAVRNFARTSRTFELYGKTVRKVKIDESD